MNRIIIYIGIIAVMISCGQIQKEASPSSAVKGVNRILIGTVKTELKAAKFHVIDQPEVVAKYLDIFVDTADYNIPQLHYDHRIQLYSGEKIVQEVYVNEMEGSFSFHGTYNMPQGIVRNHYWNSLAAYMKQLESKMFVFPNNKIAEEFYQLAKSRGAFVSTPYFCNWREHQGELIMKTDLNGDPVSIDSLEHIFEDRVPDYKFEIQSMDFGFGQYRHPKMVKIYSSRDFFENFEFRGRNFTEKIDSTFHLNGEDFIYDKSDSYTEFGLFTPNFINYDSIKVIERPDTIDFEDLWQENYMVYNPVVEVAASPETISYLYDWIKENNDNKK